MNLKIEIVKANQILPTLARTERSRCSEKEFETAVEND